MYPSSCWKSQIHLVIPSSAVYCIGERGPPNKAAVSKTGCPDEPEVTTSVVDNTFSMSI